MKMIFGKFKGIEVKDIETAYLLWLVKTVDWKNNDIEKAVKYELCERIKKDELELKNESLFDDAVYPHSYEDIY